MQVAGISKADLGVGPEFIREEAHDGGGDERGEGEDGVHDGDALDADAQIPHVDRQVRQDAERRGRVEEHRQLQWKERPGRKSNWQW